ncbi:MAG: M20/M25/M40 family metallo-hydrolase [Lachnospiraceae bacterium]|nr:M20/M25/M40 family metallo-hydrolase [Lachnospiraceae bacterium]
MADLYKTDRNRILQEFFRLTSFDAESFHERKIAEYVKEKLKALGLRVEEDQAGDKLAALHPDSNGTASNIYAYLKGTKPGDPILFSSHFDTVSPGKGKKAILLEDGTITSDGTTVLGADDISGLVSILEALTVIHENEVVHPDIEILITVAEEPYCEGSRFVEFERLKAKQGYVLDLDGPVGRVATAAPSILSLKIGIEGRASHAGFAPELGVNALSIAADALSKIQVGRVQSDLTVNFGTIRGGSGRNIVPQNVEIEGEIRSLNHEKALQTAQEIREVFEQAAESLGGKIAFSVNEHIRSYSVSHESEVVKRFCTVVEERMPERRPELLTTYGGSDANRLNENGIETIVLACGMNKCHSTEEYTTIEALEQSARLTLGLMIQEASNNITKRG